MSKSPIYNSTQWVTEVGGIVYDGGVARSPGGFEVNTDNQLNVFGLSATGILLKEAVTFPMVIGHIDVFGVDTLQFNVNGNTHAYRFDMGGDVIGMAAGFMSLPKEPTADSHAVTKKYVDDSGKWDDATGGISYTGGKVGINTTSPLANLDVRGTLQVDRPSDFWSGADYYDVAGYGGIASQGSYQITTTCNGYRNSSATWTGLNVNGFTGASMTALSPKGFITFHTDAVKADGSSPTPTERMRIDSAGLVTAGGGFEVNTDNQINVFGVSGTGLALKAAVSNKIAIGQVNLLSQDSLDFNTNNAAQSYRFWTGSSDVISMSAGFMSLPLTPTADSHAVRKDYVDDQLHYLLPKVIGKISSAGGMTSTVGISSVSKAGTGTYDITLSSAIPTADQIIQVTTDYGTLCGGGIPLSTTQIRVTIINVLTNVYQDSGFCITVNNGP